MKKSKKILLSLLVIIVLLAVIVATILLSNNKDEISNYALKVNYFEDYAPGYNHEIYFVDSSTIKVVSQAGCSTVECMEGTYEPPKQEKNINFTKESMQKLWDWANQLINNNSTNTDKKIDLISSHISDYDKLMIRSIIENNESYLQNNNVNEKD